MTQLHDYDGWGDDFCTNTINIICEKSAVANEPLTGCNDGWMSFFGSCFLFIDDIKENWTHAINHCSSHRAPLATIESAAENNFIEEQSQRFVQCEHPAFWLGANDRGVEGVWAWYTSDEPAAYTDWYTSTNIHAVQPEIELAKTAFVATNTEALSHGTIAIVIASGILYVKNLPILRTL